MPESFFFAAINSIGVPLDYIIGFLSILLKLKSLPVFDLLIGFLYKALSLDVVPVLTSKPFITIFFLRGFNTGLNILLFNNFFCPSHWRSSINLMHNYYCKRRCPNSWLCIAIKKKTPNLS